MPLKEYTDEEWRQTFHTMDEFSQFQSSTRQLAKNYEENCKAQSENKEDDLRGIEHYTLERVRKRRERRQAIYDFIYEFQETQSNFMFHCLAMIRSETGKEARIRGIVDRTAVHTSNLSPKSALFQRKRPVFLQQYQERTQSLRELTSKAA